MPYLLLFAALLSLSAEAKRVAIPPSDEEEAYFSEPETRHLARRVARDLKKCPGLENGVDAEVTINVPAGQAPGAYLVQELRKTLRGKSESEVPVKAFFHYRAWKKGKYSGTFTLQVTAEIPGQAPCTKMHKTAILRGSDPRPRHID